VAAHGFEVGVECGQQHVVWLFHATDRGLGEPSGPLGRRGPSLANEALKQASYPTACGELSGGTSRHRATGPDRDDPHDTASTAYGSLGCRSEFCRAQPVVGAACCVLRAACVLRRIALSAWFDQDLPTALRRAILDCAAECPPCRFVGPAAGA
jgi:hypothetical protein